MPVTIYNFLKVHKFCVKNYLAMDANDFLALNIFTAKDSLTSIARWFLTQSS